jgi:hypothetical protein
VFGCAVSSHFVDAVNFVIVSRTNRGSFGGNRVQPGSLGHFAIGEVSEFGRDIVVAGTHAF